MANFEGHVHVLGTGTNSARVMLDADTTRIMVGGDRSGEIVVADDDGRHAVTIEAIPGGGRIRMRGDAGIVAELVSALGASVMALGGAGVDGSVRIRNAAGTTVIVLDGRDADITIEGADAAEEFPLVDGVPPPRPGTVMVFTDDGHVRESFRPYDTRVAGVVSGAGERRPGIILGSRGRDPGRTSIALAGTVMCLVSAADAPILPGSLLTTSGQHGHAMLARDRGAAFGAVLGKALRRVDAGRDLIPVLVALR